MQTLPENSNRAVDMSMQDLSQDILNRVRTHGGTDAMVLVNQSSGFSVDVRLGEVEAVAFNEDSNVSLVIYIGKRKGSASSTETSPTALDAMVKAAYEIAEVSASDPCFGLADSELMSTQHPELDLYHPWSIKPPEAIKMALECEAHALALDKRITNSDGVNLSTYSFANAFATTNGGQGLIKGTRHSISCSLLAKEGNLMQRDYDYSTSRRFDSLSSLDEIAHSAARRTLSRLGARKIKTQKAPVLFSSRLSSSLFSSFINAISGGNLYRNNSFLLNSLGKSVFPAGFKIYEQPYLKEALGSAPFDGEGVPTRNNIFVEDGVVCQYVLSSYSARRLGLKTTANTGGVHNLTIDPTGGNLQDLIKQMDKGLLVTELMGQGINGLTGDYSRGASGFWVEHGEIQYPVEEITIAGNLKEMFKGICAVGSDINPNISTRCGSVLINQMMIAGH